MGGLDDQDKKGGTRAFGTVDPAAPKGPLKDVATSKTVAAPGGAPVGAAPPAAGTGVPSSGGSAPPGGAPGGSAPPGGAPGGSGDGDGDPLVGQTLVGRYFIEKKLGEGGMGAVYLATHVALEKRVALKVLHGEFARKTDLIERFLQEAKAASRIRHDNVIDITDFGQTEDGWVFFAMELLDGSDLSEMLIETAEAGEAFPWARTKPIYLQVCSALSAAHHQGIIHRDLKPENIYLVERYGQSDFVKLLDFGIAKLTEVSEEGKKLTRTGMLFGTPEYMSPEQARGEKVDHRVDVYAMGCILYQMVSGRVPFEADNFMGILTKHLTEPTPPLGAALARVGAPPEVEAIAFKALAKERDDRWSSIDELAEALAALDDGVEVDLARPATATVSVADRANTASGGASAVPAGPARTQWTGSLRLHPGDEADEPAPRRKPPVAAIAGGLVVVVAAVLFAVFAGGSDEAPAGRAPGPDGVEPTPASAAAAPAAQPAPTPAAAAAPSAPVPAEPAMVVVSIASEPPGATVTDAATGEIVGKTPYETTVEQGDEPLTFTVDKRGFEPQQVVLVPSEQTNARTAELVRKRRGDSRRPPTRPADESPADDGTPDDGLKNPFEN